MIYYNTFAKAYLSTLLEVSDISHGCTTRDAGDGRNIENIISFLRINQVIFKKIVMAEQIHSANVQIFSSSNNLLYERLEDTDGLVTRDRKVVLAVRTADCIPIFYADKKHGIIGISHNGWRGTLKRISQRILDSMEKIGAHKKDIVAVLGPGINSCCYDISEERYFDFMSEFEDDFGAFPVRMGRRYMNLFKLNFELLRKFGLQKENIDFFPFCTMCNKEHFFSYRRDYHRQREKFGEMFSYIGLN